MTQASPPQASPALNGAQRPVAPAPVVIPQPAPAQKMTRRQRKLEAITAKNHVPGNGPVVTTAKDSKKVKVRAVVWPVSGQPYEEDVQVDDQGTFTLKDSSLTFTVSRGSAWRGLDGLVRIPVREDQASTINVQSLQGENILHPMTLNGIVQNNLWNQFSDWMSRRAFWRQAGTWGMIGIGLGILGALVWMIKTQGTGFEDLKNALQAWGGETGAGGSTPAEEAGHNNIAPGA